MKIAIDIRGAHLYHGTGIGTYTKNLVKHLLKIDMKNNYDLFYCGENPQEFKKDNTNIHLISRKHSSFFEQKYIPNIIKKNSSSILPQQTAPSPPADAPAGRLFQKNGGASGAYRWAGWQNP